MPPQSLLFASTKRQPWPSEPRGLGQQHYVSVRCQQLPPLVPRAVPVLPPHPLGPTVNIHYGGKAPARLEVRRVVRTPQMILPSFLLFHRDATVCRHLIARQELRIRL